MSDIPRYRPVSNDRYGITDDADGKLCEYRDYARLKAEVERLTIAGDEMAHKLENYGNYYLTSQWEDAKEGKGQS